MNQKSPPHFLCIGSRRSGTTWLYTNLKPHPSIWMPPVKSIRYFNNYESQTPWIVDMWFGHKRAMRRRLRRALPEIIRGQNTKWYLRYFFLPRNDTWYFSLFQPSLGQISGEVCHAYGSLNSQTIAKVSTLLPDAKIIYLIRNPLERIWSEAALYFRRRGQKIGETTTDDTVMEVLNRYSVPPHSDDLAKLSAWQRHYPEQQFFVGFFDQLREQPARLLSDIHTFLAVSSSKQHIPANVDQKVGSTPYLPLLGRFASYLAQMNGKRIEELHHYFDNQYTEGWCQDAKRYL